MIDEYLEKCLNCEAFKNNKRPGIDILSVFIDLGQMAKVLRDPMSIEEACDIVDPLKDYKMPEDENEAMALDTKARCMVAEYVRQSMEKDQ